MRSTKELRDRRHARVRKKVVGAADHPRLSVFRSLRHIYAQVVDDSTRTTLASASTLDAELKGTTGAKADSAKAVGGLVAKRAIEKGVKRVTFDRGGYKYHGRVKSLADAAREAGLDF